MKKNLFAALTMVATIISALMSSCASESLHMAEPTSVNQALSIEAEKAFVEVESFENVDATTSDRLTYKTSDGNVLRGKAVGLQPKNVFFDYTSVDENSRVVKVSFLAEETDGTQHTATTSYIQKLKASEPVIPDEPTIVDYRLEHTRDLFNTEIGEKNQVCSGLVNAWLVTVYSDGHEDKEQILKNHVYTVYRVAGGIWDEFHFIANTESTNKAFAFESVTRDNERTSEETPVEGVKIVSNFYDLHYNVKGFTSDYITYPLMNLNVEFHDFYYSTTVAGKELSFSYAAGTFSFDETPSTKSENRNKSAYVDRYTVDGVNYVGTHPYLMTYVIKFGQYVDGESIDALTLETSVYTAGEITTE